MRVSCKGYEDIKKRYSGKKHLQFNSEIYHRYDPIEKVCTMCVVGAVARGFGVSDIQYWIPDYYPPSPGVTVDLSLSKNVMLANRFQFLNMLRQGIFISKIYFTGWPEKSNDVDWKNFRLELIEIYKNNKPAGQMDIDGFIQLYKHYAQLFKKFKL